MEGPISFWGYKEQESNLILPEHDDEELYYLKRTQHDCTSAKCAYKSNTTVTGHKWRTVGFRQRKPLPMSTANSWVCIIT